MEALEDMPVTEFEARYAVHAWLGGGNNGAVSYVQVMAWLKSPDPARRELGQQAMELMGFYAARCCCF